MAGHTPGPWTVGNTESAYLEVVIDDSDPGLAVVARVEEQATEKEEIANAHLIAAAPELLEALKALMERVAEVSFIRREGVTGGVVTVSNACGDWLTEFEAAEAAIAKAEGR